MLTVKSFFTLHLIRRVFFISAVAWGLDLGQGRRRVVTALMIRGLDADVYPNHRNSGSLSLPISYDILVCWRGSYFHTVRQTNVTLGRSRRGCFLLVTLWGKWVHETRSWGGFGAARPVANTAEQTFPGMGHHGKLRCLCQKSTTASQ